MYATNEGGRIKLVDLKSDNTTDLVVLTDIRDVSTNPVFINIFLRMSRGMACLLDLIAGSYRQT